MTVSPSEKYRARVDELAALASELASPSRSDLAPAVGRALEAAGDLLRRRGKVPHDEALLEAVLAAVPEPALHAWVDGVKGDEVAAHLERAADEAVEAALPEREGDGPTFAAWAMQTLRLRDRLESARTALAHMAERGRPGARVALERLSRELQAADRRARRCKPRLSALNAQRRDELALLDEAQRPDAWWYGEQSGLEHDLLVKVLGGEARGVLPAPAQWAHDVVTHRHPRRFSFDELFRFDLGLAGADEQAAIREAARTDPSLARALEAMRAGDEAIAELIREEPAPVKPVTGGPPSTTFPSHGPELVEERTEFKLLVFRTRERVEVVVQPRRHERFAAAALFLSNSPQRTVGFESAADGLHFDVGPAERVRGLVARVVITLADGRSLTSEVRL